MPDNSKNFRREMGKRVTSASSSTAFVDLSNRDAVIRRVLQPSRFFVATGNSLRIDMTREKSEVWEVFNGQLLGRGQTREEATFDSWRLFLDTPNRSADEPLVEVKWHAASQRVCVTRSLLIRGWETYEPRPNVIESRPAELWTRELVSCLRVDHTSSEETLVRELQVSVRQALAGTSRLAITSLENPLPEFALGRVAYFPTPARLSEQPTSNPCELAAQISSSSTDALTSAQSLEAALRSVEPTAVPMLAQSLVTQFAECSASDADVAAIFRALFNRVSLSPYTRLTDNLVELLACLSKSESIGPEPIVDTISYMLRHLVRHLTAFNLTVFHNQGANYPDALFLDRLIAEYVRLVKRCPALFTGDRGRQRRRALRQAYWMRRSLEGVCFPDAPTSPGENQRVLPAEVLRVPDQQILDPSTRTHVLFEPGSTDELFAGDIYDVFATCLADLTQVSELRELGTAVFLDRPLGVFHPPGHPDRTPLVSYQAYSNRIAAERLSDLCDAQPLLDRTTLRGRVPKPEDCRGIGLAQVGGDPRPGVVSLADAGLVADDFVFTRTTRSGLNDLLDVLDLEQESPLAWLHSDACVLLIRTDDHLLAGFDRDMRTMFVVEPIEPIEYELRNGVERLPNGVRVLSTS